MSYAASIEGNQMFSAVSIQLSIVPAYGKEEFKHNAQADLFGGIRLFTDLVKSKKTPVS